VLEPDVGAYLFGTQKVPWRPCQTFGVVLPELADLPTEQLGEALYWHGVDPLVTRGCKDMRGGRLLLALSLRELRVAHRGIHRVEVAGDIFRKAALA